MTWLIPIISGFLYMAGGQWWKPARWLLGVPIALITHNWWYVLTYYIATSCVPYGDNSWVSKLVGRKGARIAHGITFGLASLHPLYCIWTVVVFYILFELAEHNAIDNKYAELGRGFFGTLLLAFN